MTKAERRTYDAAVDALKGEGCSAGGKRLAAADGDDFALCQRALYRAWRMTTAYLGDGSIVIVAVARHTSRQNPSATLAEVFPGLSATGRRRSEQPSCCDDPQRPPQLSAELEDLLYALFGV